jgi:hypothetical protein
MLPLMVVKSPRCDDMVTLPAGLTPESRVRCPFTKEEFLVQEILDQLPPMLEVVDGPVAASAASAGAMAATMFEDAGTETAAESAADSAFGFMDTAEKPDTAEQDGETVKGAALFKSEAGSEQPSASAFDFAAADVAESAAADEAIGAAPAGRKPRPRPKKKPKNAAAEIIKIVLGGIAGLVIAQAIMWWGMKTDPFTLAPKLPSWLAWAAPASLRNPDAVPEQPVDGDQVSENGSGQTGQNGQAGQNSEPELDQPYDPNAPFPAAGTGLQAPDVIDDTDEHAAGPDVPGTGGDSDFAHTAVVDDGTLENLPDDPPPDEPVEERLGVRSAPSYTGDELGEALKAANEAKAEVDADGGMDLKNRAQQAANMYRVLCNLSERATFVDPNGNQVRDRLAAAEGILLDLSEKKSQLDAIGRFGATWLELAEKRPGNGIVLAGTVMSITPQGRLFDTELQLFAGGQPVVTVMSKNDPQEAYSKGDRVIILGSVVEEPSLKLAGYEGNLPIVTWGGYPVILPKTEKKGPNRPRGGGQ